jgi:protein-S-isoprenylcysteine O-methyltransferase Ste14
MIAKLLLQTLIWIVAMGALLFVPAGTLHWPQAWLYLGALAITGICSGLWLARTDPGLLAERMHPMMQSDQPPADKKFIVAFGFAALGWLVAIGFDQRIHGTRVSFALQALGLTLLALSFGIIVWVMRENSFAAPVVKLQPDRGQRVVSTGPYAFVRHPMTAAPCCSLSALPCFWAPGGGSPWRRCSPCCSPSARGSRNAP